MDYYLVSKGLIYQDKKGRLLELTNDDYLGCLEINPKTADDTDELLLLGSWDEAVKLAGDGLGRSKKRFPIFKVSYEPDGNEETDTIDLEDTKASIPAIVVLAKDVTVISATLGHVDPRFTEVSLKAPESDDEDEVDLKAPSQPVNQKPSQGKALLRSTLSFAARMAKPTFAVGVGVAGWYFGANDWMLEQLASYGAALPAALDPRLIQGVVSTVTSLATYGAVTVGQFATNRIGQRLARNKPASSSAKDPITFSVDESSARLKAAQEELSRLGTTEIKTPQDDAPSNLHSLEQHRRGKAEKSSTSAPMPTSNSERNSRKRTLH